MIPLGNPFKIAFRVKRRKRQQDRMAVFRFDFLDDLGVLLFKNRDRGVGKMLQLRILSQFSDHWKSQSFPAEFQEDTAKIGKLFLD